MTARYWVLASDKLMAANRPWEDLGLHVIGPATAPPPNPGMQWWQFEDDNAPATLNGKRVELIIERRDGKPVLTGRRPAL